MVLRPLSGFVPFDIGASLAEPAASAGSTTGSPSPAGHAAESLAGDATAEPAEPLDVCLLSYRSNPYSGGQGVYVKYLSRALTAHGHSVTVVSGRPYPDLDDGVDLVKLPGENVFEADSRLRAFELEYLTEPTKFREWAGVLTGGFPEPYTFGERAVDYLADHADEFDVIHDNQSLCYGLLDLLDRDLPVVATIHHPITVDRDVDLTHTDGLAERLLVRRWYSFLGMQREVASELPHVISVSEATRHRTVADFGTDESAISVVPNGLDTELFRPRPDVPEGAERVMTTVSADTPIKGTRYLLEALADLRERRPDVELVVVGEFSSCGEPRRIASELDLWGAIETHSEISYERMVELYGSAAVAVVPSVFEGFGLPAAEAMACGLPVVATTGGALPEVVGDAGRLVEPADSTALADAVDDLLADPAERERLGRAARDRAVERFDWQRTARATVAEYRRAIDAHR